MRRTVAGPGVLQWVVSQMTNGEMIPFGGIGIGVEKDGELIGGVIFSDFNGANVNIHVAATSKHWLSREFLFNIFDYAFNQLGAKRVTGIVNDDRPEVIRFDVGIGFKYETRIRDGHPNGDILIYVMRREDCRWINELKLAA